MHYAIHILTIELYKWEGSLNEIKRSMILDKDPILQQHKNTAETQIRELMAAIDKLKTK